jgi:hypothetical protein
VNDELREQLRQLDPMHSGVPVEPPTTPSSRARLEQIMNTPLIDQNTSTDTSGHPAEDMPVRTLGRHRRRSWTILGSVAAAAAIAVGGAVIIGNSGGDGGSQVADGPPLELSLGNSSAISSCIMFDVAILADMSPAFAGTATAVEGDAVTLDVDHWYAGGDAATVLLHGSDGSPALIDGFTFEPGAHYLITAADGNVNFCGYSGLATPELTAAFDQAFGG